MIIPIFKTLGSMGRSILTVEDDDEISLEGTVSVYSIAKEFKLDKVIIFDDSFSYFRQAQINFNKLNCQLIFGINFYICNDKLVKDKNSIDTESKITISFKNDKGYKDLLKLHNYICGNRDFFYFKPRLDWKTLNSYWTENLDLIIPSYDNFIHNNLLKWGKCVPDLGQIKAKFTYSRMDLPFDELLIKNITQFAQNNNYSLFEVHPIYYFLKDDFKAYTVFRCIDNRSSFSKPELDFFCSPEFSWQSYCEKENIKYDWGKFIKA